MIISSIRAVVEAITGFNESVTFLQWLRSLQSRSNGAENRELSEDDVLKLQTSRQCLEATLPVMRDLIDRAEWKAHEKCVEELLPELRATVYDAEDIVDVLRDYERKVKNEGSSATSMELFHDVIQGNFKKLNHIKERLHTLSSLLKRFGIDQDTPPRFDRSVRPETSSFSIEAEIFGRDDEIKKLISLLGVPGNNSNGPSTRKRSRSDNTEATISSVPVLPIVGIGGVGKTTLVQNICSHPHVKKHFDSIVWICVSDDFDVKRLTKEAIQQFSRKAPTTNNLNSLQNYLIDNINKTRFLFVLDDVWVEDAELWKRFYAPFKHVLEGSMMLVTTRSQKVADIVRTTDPFSLEGLVDGEFQKFFKQCVFGSDCSSINPELEQIGEQILPKLKGSPLAAKTLGRLLGMGLDPAHWNMILNSQLWVHKQQDTEIMPALRLSYIYLPLHLKRCFSFCAVYPKDYIFVKEDLAEIWMAEGFVVAQDNIPLQQTACNYFEELANLSFFQKLHGKYVMHDLIHDLAQLVSGDDCYIIKEKKDLERFPENVRHLSVLESSDFKWSELSLWKHTKLRTLLLRNMCLIGQDGNTMMKNCCTELLCMRVMVMYCSSAYLNSIHTLPDGISNMKNLRYLKFSGFFKIDRLPATFCQLYNLQLFSAPGCNFEEIPRDFSNLTNLQKFELQSLNIDAAMENGERIKLLKDSNLITRGLSISNLCEISKDQALEIELMKKEYISRLTLKWSNGASHLSGSPEDNDIEVFKALHPPTNIQYLCLEGYPGEYLASWFHGSDDPTIFSSLEKITVTNCPRLSSLEQFLQPAYMPAIKKMEIRDCTSLEIILGERFGSFHGPDDPTIFSSLTEITVRNCPKLSSLEQFLQPAYMPAIKKIFISDCTSLLEIVLGERFGGFHHPDDPTIFSSLTNITVTNCPKLSSLVLHPAYMPAIEKIEIRDCKSLEFVQERFSAFPSLKGLAFANCPKIRSP